MKRTYINPDIKAIKINTETLLNTGSQWNEDEQTGINPNPGSQGDYGAKDDLTDYNW